MKTKTLIEKIQSAGAHLEVNGDNLVVKRKQGPLADYLMEELRRHKAEVISTLREGQTGQHFETGEHSDIIPGKERYLYNFVGDRVLFLLKGSVEGCLATKGTVFAEGIILSQRWLGYTRRGQIPEYELQIATDDGQVYVRRLVDDYISELRGGQNDAIK